MSWDAIKSVCDIVAVLLLFLTFAIGTVAWYAGDKINERQAQQLRQFALNMEAQKAKTATAEAELLRLQQQRLPRTLKFESDDSLQALITSLKRTPFTAEILYKKGGGEASWFAEQIRGLLLSAGWTVPHSSPLSEDLSANAVEKLKAQPDGVTLITKESSEKDKPGSPEPILANLLSQSLGSIARSWDEKLPDKNLKIIILQKP